MVKVTRRISIDEDDMGYCPFASVDCKAYFRDAPESKVYFTMVDPTRRVARMVVFDIHGQRSSLRVT